VISWRCVDVKCADRHIQYSARPEDYRVKCGNASNNWDSIEDGTLNTLMKKNYK
jgi:hypothetical protein